jgi:tetratricopeptide (TPR) repeat protein
MAAEDVQSLYSLGRGAFERRNFEEALDYFQRLVQRMDRFADVWNMMGQIHHETGEMDLAQDCFQKALDLNPHYTDALFNLAIVYSEIGKYDQAQALYDRARSQEHGQGDRRIADPTIRGKLANMHADLGDLYLGLGLFHDAADEYRKALTLRPEFPDIRLSMARTLFEAGKKSAALAELAEIKSSRPDYLKARLQLGLYLFSMGHSDAAVKEWSEILAEFPGHQRAQTYLRLARKTIK